MLPRVMNINLKSVLFLSQSIAKDMIERGDGGAIVNVSSQASQRALAEHTVYCEWDGILGRYPGPFFELHGLRPDKLDYWFLILHTRTGQPHPQPHPPVLVT